MTTIPYGYIRINPIKDGPKQDGDMWWNGRDGAWITTWNPGGQFALADLAVQWIRPINVGEGYRLVTEGGAIQEGDEFFDSVALRWESGDLFRDTFASSTTGRVYRRRVQVNCKEGGKNDRCGMGQPMTPERQHIINLCDEFASKLAEHCDSVQIFVSMETDDGSNLTDAYHCGRGNYYARLGHVAEWLEVQRQYQRNYANNNITED